MVHYLLCAEQRRVDQLSVIRNQGHGVKGQVVVTILRRGIKHLQQHPGEQNTQKITNETWLSAALCLPLFGQEQLQQRLRCGSRNHCPCNILVLKKVNHNQS